MMIKQLSVFLENKTGRLTDITGILAEHNINISAFSIADSADFGILRMITSDNHTAERMLREQGIAVQTTDVVCLIVPHAPGGLHKPLQLLSSHNIQIDYMYAYATGTHAIVAIRTPTPQDTLTLLKEHNYQFLEE
ncbi:ACT domain-containing protein [Prosthecochloris vibrioformis]|uniref:ACT domain-containing protein n=1 Tax=Prosthecochloris vibrioformis TaxID=1098 RepID=A0A5C4S0W9_PROVB|nr:ACT domain-containing protein [Prosthecochloris vibrioformis]TNJ36849.1 ACT domain-containing protein [Prosthecochloris vibrioformis]